MILFVDGGRLDAIAHAVERTAATGRARVSVEAVTDARPLIDGPEMKLPPSPQPGLRGLLNRATSMIFRLVVGCLANYASAPGRAIGFLEFESRRSAIDYGAYAELVDGSNQWDGRSGRALATLGSDPVQATGPLWLFDLLRGVADASHVGSDTVRGRVCDHVRASVDVARVSAARPDPTPLPPGTTFEALEALPLEVWLDDEGLVRRIRFEYDLPTGARRTSLELFDFGTAASVDWSRLPIFKDPRTGAAVGAAA